MPLEMSNANFTAWLWSTTRAEEEEDTGGQEREVQSMMWRGWLCDVIRLQWKSSAILHSMRKKYMRHVDFVHELKYVLVPWCSMLKRDPYGMLWVMMMGWGDGGD